MKRNDLDQALESCEKVKQRLAVLRWRCVEAPAPEQRAARAALATAYRELHARLDVLGVADPVQHAARTVSRRD